MEAQLIPGQCRSSFPNSNGTNTRWAVQFVPENFKYSAYIQPCEKGCGRSGYCTQLGGPNVRCGPIKTYAFGMCQE